MKIGSLAECVSCTILHGRHNWQHDLPVVGNIYIVSGISLKFGYIKVDEIELPMDKWFYLSDFIEIQPPMGISVDEILKEETYAKCVYTNI